MENIIISEPVIAKPELKITEPKSPTPRSLRALLYQLNQGDKLIAVRTMKKPNNGAVTPKNPASRRIVTFNP
jgi:hypothetical protein